MKAYHRQPRPSKRLDDLSDEAIALLRRIRHLPGWYYCLRESPRGKLIEELVRARLVHAVDPGGPTIGVPPHGGRNGGK